VNPKGTSIVRAAKFAAAVCLMLETFMVRPPIRAEAAAKPRGAAASAEAIPLPTTPAGHQFAQWLQAFNTGDAKEIRGFISKHFAEAALKRIPADERAAMDTILYSISRGVVPYGIDWSTDPEITVLARANLTEECARIHLEVGSDPLHNITKFSFTLTGHPADIAPAGRLAEAQIVQRLEIYMNKLAAAEVFSGATLVAKNGKAIFEKAYGLANQDSKAPNRLDTKFNLASMNKMFTGVAIVQLAEQGKLSLDATISKYLPDYPNKQVSDSVTVHQLLTHTSGMGDYVNSRFEAAKADVRSVRDYFPLFTKDRLSFQPGEKWGYSNAGYIVLGAIIEAVSGQSYFDYVREHIYKPAGMDDTDSYEMDRDTPNLAKGYTHLAANARLESLSPRDNSSMLPVKGGPAGGGFSTVEDLLKFAVALRAHKLLSPKFTELAVTGKVERGDEGGGKYAYGFAEDRVNGQRIVGYEGGHPGANGELDVYWDVGYTVAVLSNCDPPSAQRVAYKLRDMIVPKE